MGAVRRRLRTRLAGPLLAAAVLVAPGRALACAVCAAGETNNRAEFILTTAFMTALPLLLVGGVVLYLRARARRVHGAPPSPTSALEEPRRVA